MHANYLHFYFIIIIGLLNFLFEFFKTRINSNISIDLDHHRQQQQDEESKSEQQRHSNVEAQHGEDFRQKLLFYEKNAAPNEPTSPRRSSFQQSKLFDRPTPQQVFTHIRPKTDQMQRSKSYKDLLDPPIAHPIYHQQQQQHPSLYNNNTPLTIAESMLGNGKRQPNINNLVSDDVSSSSTGHLPKPPPGIPSQNAR